MDHLWLAIVSTFALWCIWESFKSIRTWDDD
jgi:hypothetical protein